MHPPSAFCLFQCTDTASVCCTDAPRHRCIMLQQCTEDVRGKLRKNLHLTFRFSSLTEQQQQQQQKKKQTTLETISQPAIMMSSLFFLLDRLRVFAISLYGILFLLLKERQKQHSLYQLFLIGFHLQEHSPSYLKHCSDRKRADEPACPPSRELFLLPPKSISTPYPSQNATEQYEKNQESKSRILFFQLKRNFFLIEE